MYYALYRFETAVDGRLVGFSLMADLIDLTAHRFRCHKFTHIAISDHFPVL